VFSLFVALLAAAAPDKAPFMADECLKAIPDIDGIDYTTKEYLNFVQHISQTVNRLNAECKYHGNLVPYLVSILLTCNPEILFSHRTYVDLVCCYVQLIFH